MQSIIKDIQNITAIIILDISLAFLLYIFYSIYSTYLSIQYISIYTVMVYTVNILLIIYSKY